MKKILAIISFMFINISFFGENILIFSDEDASNYWNTTIIKEIKKEYAKEYNILDLSVSNEEEIDELLESILIEGEIASIVTLDKKSYEYINTSDKNLLKGIPIINTNINNNKDLFNKDVNVYNQIDIENNINFAKQIFPQMEGVLLINYEKNYRGKVIGEKFEDTEGDYPNIKFESIGVEEDELEEKLENLPQNYVIFQGEIGDTLLSNGDYNIYWSKLKDLAKNPIFVFWDTRVAYDGVFGGYVNVLERVNFNIIKAIKDSLNNGNIEEKLIYPNLAYVVNYKTLTENNIPLSRLPKNTRLKNHSIGDIDTYRRRNLISFTSVLLLFLFSIYLAFTYGRTQKLTRNINKYKEELSKKNKDLIEAYNSFSLKLATIAESYDSVTGQHVHRVGELSEYLASLMGIDNEKVKEIGTFAPLHDIGKIYMPKEILNKKGSLSGNEWEIMKTHTIKGGELLGGDKGFETARNIALYHHEKYDGSGYPYNLIGEEIPVEACIVSLIDAYDALRSPRPYKKSLSHDEVMDILLKGDGRTKPEHFNPKVLETFKTYEHTFEKIWEKYSVDSFLPSKDLNLKVV